MLKRRNAKRLIQKKLTRRERQQAAEREEKLAEYETRLRENIKTAPPCMLAQMLPNHVYERVLRVVEQLALDPLVSDSISFSLLGSIESIEGSCEGHTGAVILWNELVRVLRERFMSNQISGRRGEWAMATSATIELSVKCDQCGRERNGWRWEGARKNTSNPIESDNVLCPRCRHEEHETIAQGIEGREEEEAFDAGNTGLRWRELVSDIPTNILPTILTRVIYKVDPSLGNEWLSMLHDGISMVEIPRLCRELGTAWRDSGLSTLERRPEEVRRLRRLRAEAAASDSEERTMADLRSRRPADGSTAKRRARRRKAVA